MKFKRRFFFQLILISLNLLLHFTNATSQITLDRQVDSSAYPALWRMVQISETETKYFFPDTVNNTFSLLNMDFTPFINNIQIPDPWAWTTAHHYEAYYITRDLFDCDTSNIEFVFAAPLSAVTPFRVLRTDGTQIFRLDSAIAFFCGGDCGNGGSEIISPITNTSAGAKLVLGKVNSGHEVDYIYSLCGTLPEVSINYYPVQPSYITLFPNPTSSILKFQINFPNNLNDYDLLIVDNTGKEVRKVHGNNLDRIIYINVDDLNNGTYIYSLCTKNKNISSGKFIVTK